MAFLRQSDFTPLFRLLDDYETHRSTPTKPIHKYTPPFDVRESSDGYHLDGELPGIDQSNIEIEFSDPQTLLIKGRTERNYPPTPTPKQQTEEVVAQAPSSPKHQATVEDDDEEDNEGSIHSSQNSETHTQTQVQTKQTPTSATATATATANDTKFRFWASERSIGEFERTFTFGSRVDQDGVRASLKNGILSVYLPKEAQPKMKKIRILWESAWTSAWTQI